MSSALARIIRKPIIIDQKPSQPEPIQRIPARASIYYEYIVAEFAKQGIFGEIASISLDCPFIPRNHSRYVVEVGKFYYDRATVFVLVRND